MSMVYILRRTMYLLRHGIYSNKMNPHTSQKRSGSPGSSINGYYTVYIHPRTPPGKAAQVGKALAEGRAMSRLLTFPHIVVLFAFS